MIEVTATLRGTSLSAQKGRLVADMIRLHSVARALDILRFTTKKGARLMVKLLESAIANAEHNHGADVDDLVVHRVFVDEGPTLKRVSPRAKGRANRISKRSSHITIIVSNGE